MGLSREEKEALHEHYRGKDLYDPASDPKQQPHDYQPQPMNMGGECYSGGGTVGYQEGGNVGIDLGNLFDTGTAVGFEGPQISSDDNIPEKNRPPVIQAPVLKQIAASQPPVKAPVIAPKPIETGISASNPAPRPSSLSPDQFDELIAGLQPGLGQRIGQGAMSGIAGLADAIEKGVAGAPGSEFQKNIEETRQNRARNLAEALKSKYETRYKGQELSQNQKRLEEETRHNREMEIEAMGRLGAEKQGRQLEAQKIGQEQTNKQRELDLKTVQDYGIFKSGGPSRELYEQAKARLSGQGAGAVGPLGATTVKNGKTYEWSPTTQKYHLVK